MSINKTLFTISANEKNELIHGIIESPAKNCAEGAAIVFLHGWGGYRTGPHDMFVKMSRSLAVIGFTCVRFDFRGRGYSGTYGSTLTQQTMVQDLEAVLRYINDCLGIEKISLIGICSGARLALYYAMKGKMPIQHVAGLSLPPLKSEEVRRRTAFNKSITNLNLYLEKLKERSVWNRIFRGEINYRQIFRIIFSSVPDLLHGGTPKRNLSGIPLQKKSAERFKHFRGDMLFIYGGRDPEAEPSLLQIKHLTTRFSVRHTIYKIEKANHSFYAREWENEIIKVTVQWLSGKRKVSDGANNENLNPPIRSPEDTKRTRSPCIS